MSITSKPKIICLTPVKNEAWILERFLKLTSLWADHIIIADQNSKDNSREIANQFEKVILIENNSESFNEPERQQLLLSEARKIKGVKLLITLDADEWFTPNFAQSQEWATMLKAEPGTIFRFRLFNIQPGLEQMWPDLHTYPLAYMDDGAEHTGPKIHSFRIPLPENNPTILMNEIKIIHYSETDWKRTLSKRRWYMCYERIAYPKRSSVDIFRANHHRFFFPESRFEKVPKDWIDEYTKQGIDMTSIYSEPKPYWDEDILKLFDKYGSRFFRRERIWEADWCKIAVQNNKDNVEKYKDPRNWLNRKIQTYLWLTQKKFNKKYILFLDKILKIALKY